MTRTFFSSLTAMAESGHQGLGPQRSTAPCHREWGPNLPWLGCRCARQEDSAVLAMHLSSLLASLGEGGARWRDWVARGIFA